MGLVNSKDEAGRVVLAGVPKDILDYKGRDLRDTLDACLEKYMWTFTIGGLLISAPICLKYKTQNPLITAAVISPLLDMAYGTHMCSAEKDAFVAHYKGLQAQYAQTVDTVKQMGALPDEQQQQQQRQQQR